MFAGCAPVPPHDRKDLWSAAGCREESSGLRRDQACPAPLAQLAGSTVTAESSFRAHCRDALVDVPPQRALCQARSDSRTLGCTQTLRKPDGAGVAAEGSGVTRLGPPSSGGGVGGDGRSRGLGGWWRTTDAVCALAQRSASPLEDHCPGATSSSGCPLAPRLVTQPVWTSVFSSEVCLEDGLKVVNAICKL